MTDYTQQLAGFLADLRYQDLPPAVLVRMEELSLDWLGSALAGKGQHPIPLFERYAERMGPADDSAQILPNRRRNSSYFAALVNGAASHVVEQDDLHSSLVLHPAAVVLPAALATVQGPSRGGAELILTAVTGYEAGIRIGEFLGRSHYRVFHTIATVDIFAVTVAMDKLMDFDRERFVDLLGSAGIQAAKLREFLRDAADSKQLHTAKTAADGLLATYLTADGLNGARHILEDEQGMVAGISGDADPEHLMDCLGSRWALLETLFEFHASYRHTHPTAGTLLALMQREGLNHSQIATVTVRVRQGTIDVLGQVVEPQTMHQAKFSMDVVLDLIAVYGKADFDEFHRHALSDSRVTVLRGQVEMCLDPGVDAVYPQRWLGQVEVLNNKRRRHIAAIDKPKGDPGSTLSRDELADKFRHLPTFFGTAADTETEILIRQAWSLCQAPSITPLI